MKFICIIFLKILIFINCFGDIESLRNICSNDKCYHLEKFLGAGAFGSVYLAKTPTEEKFAIKSFHKRNKLMDYDWYEEEANREYQVGIQLNHPHIIKVHEIFCEDNEEGKDLHLVVEYVEGRTLHEFQKNVFSKDQTLRLTLQLVETLRYAVASNNIINIDLSTTNVMITQNFDLFFVDLGSFFQASKDEENERFLYCFDSLTELCIQFLSKTNLDTKQRISIRGEIKKVAWQFFEDIEENINNPIQTYFDDLIKVLDKELSDR